MNNTLIVLCGLPGSGKSFLARKLKNYYDCEVVSTDAIRKELFGDESIQNNNWQVFMVAYAKIIENLSLGRDVIFDATNLRTSDRRKIVKYFRTLNNKTRLICICVNTPLNTCIVRDATRNRVVGADVIIKMSKKFTQPTYAEGWDFAFFTED